MNTDFQNAIIFGVTPKNLCVGIKVFLEPCRLDENENMSAELEHHVDCCVEKAFRRKKIIENSFCDISNNDLYSSTACVSSEFIISSQKKQVQEKLLLKNENLFIKLGRSLIEEFQIKKINFEVSKIILMEINGLLSKALTPLMLKKNSKIVHGIEQICRYVNINPSIGNRQLQIDRCQEMRKLANTILNGFKNIMGFKGKKNEDFLDWFTESVKLFHELTANLTNDERRLLTTDPETNLPRII